MSATETNETNEAIYKIFVTAADDTTLALAHGSLAIVNYVAGEVARDLKNEDTDVTAEVWQTDGIGGANVRKVLAITADGDSVADLLKKRIKNERKSREIPLRDEPIGQQTSAPLDQV